MSWFLLNRNLTLLEPYDWKLSCTVLRGERGSNAPDLPGKAIASPTMAEYIKYLYKTVRKFHGIAGVVTQELNDVIDSPIVKEAIINNSDVKILLDQTKFKDRYEDIAAILGLTDIQRQQIFTINALNNHEGRSYFKEVWICRREEATSRRCGFAEDSTRMCTVWRKHRNVTGHILQNVPRRRH